MKICTTCQKQKIITEFALQSRGKDGRATICKACKSAYVKSWLDQPHVSEKRKDYMKQYFLQHQVKMTQGWKRYYELHKEEIKQKNKIYYQLNIERLREQRRDRDYKRLYGISFTQKQQLFIGQGEKCLICKKSILNIRLAFVDHDHVTKKVRGILCPRCNWVLGAVQDNTQLLENAIKYLSN